MSSTDNLTSTLTTPTTTQTSSVTTTQTTAATATDHLTNDQIAGICGGVISSVVVIVIIIIVICFVWRRRRNKKSDKKASPPSPPSADDLQPQPQPQPQPPSQMAVERKPKSRPHHALQPPQPSISSNGESYMSVPDVSTNETYEIGSTVPSIRNSSSSIDNDYENNPTRESNYRESNYRDSNYGEYIVPMENVPDQGLDSPRANPSSDNDFYFAMDKPSPSPEFYQNPDPPPRPCLSRGYVNVSQENVSQDHSSTTALPSSGIIKHESVQTKPLGSQQPVGSKRPDPIGAENGEVKGPQDPRGYKRQESDGGKEDRLKVPKHAVSPKTTVMDKCVKPVVAVKPGGGNGVKINPKLKNIASKFDETAKSNGAVGQKESLLTMHSWDKTPTPQSPRKDSTTAGQGDSDEDSDIDYENVNDYQNTPSKQVEPRRSPAGAPRNLKAHPDIHNREQRQIIGNKQKKGPAVGR